MRRKRSKTLDFLLLPALIFIGFMELCVYLLDNQYGRPSKKASISMLSEHKADNITFMLAISEEQSELIRK